MREGGRWRVLWPYLDRASGAKRRQPRCGLRTQVVRTELPRMDREKSQNMVEACNGLHQLAKLGATLARAHNVARLPMLRHLANHDATLDAETNPLEKELTNTHSHKEKAVDTGSAWQRRTNNTAMSLASSLTHNASARRPALPPPGAPAHLALRPRARRGQSAKTCAARKRTG